MTDGEREIWSEMQRDAAPTVRLFRRELRRARKARRCGCCPREIVAGSQYERQTGVEDGEFFAVCSHVHADHLAFDRAERELERVQECML